MSWATLHETSMKLAQTAEQAEREGRANDAREAFLEAAENEIAALQELGNDKPRTYGITAVSATVLFSKGKEFSQAAKIAQEALAAPFLLDSAKAELEELIEAIAEKRSTIPRNLAMPHPAQLDPGARKPSREIVWSFSVNDATYYAIIGLLAAVLGGLAAVVIGGLANTVAAGIIGGLIGGALGLFF